MQSRWIRALQALLLGILLIGVSATASAAGYYVRNGKIYRSNGQELQVKGISHFGFNSTTLQPQYLWQMGWKEQIAQMKSLGFNAIRVPFVPDTLYNTTPVDQLSYVDPILNPELLGKTPLQVLDLWMAEADRRGMYILLDFHSVSKQQQYPTWFVSNPADYHLMYNGKAYTEANWIRDLKFVASRYAGNSHFFGIDLYNEPNANVRWSTGDPNVTDPAYYWKRAAESASLAVLQANPKLLIFVQGVAGNFDGVEDSNIPMNWGEDLQPHRYQRLNIPTNKLVLTPHTYGPDVYMKSSFGDRSFPANLAADWEALFGRYHPANAVVIGEWGGRYGNGPSGEMDVTWQNALVDYLNGKGIHSSFYWCYTPNSSDTGGILNDDLTVRQDKMALLKRHWGKSRSESETPDPAEPADEGAAPPPAAPADVDAPAVNGGSSGGGGASWILPIVAGFAVAGRVARRRPGAGRAGRVWPRGWFAEPRRLVERRAHSARGGTRGIRRRTHAGRSRSAYPTAQTRRLARTDPRSLRRAATGGIMRGILLAGVASAMALLAVFVPAARAADAWPEWSAFATRFIQDDGRVIDLTFDGKSTSEGQSYGLFFALVANDRPRFDAILAWTSDNLASGSLGDELPAWHWGKREDGEWGVKDPNAASDADLWLAYTLLEAARLWHAPRCEETGRKLLALVREKEVVDAGAAGTLLLPGPVGFALKGGRYRVNPSYLPGFMFRYLAVVDPQGPWADVWQSWLRLAPQVFAKGVAPDLFVVDARGRVAQDSEREPAGSYDAIRVYTWAGMSGRYGEPLLELLRPFAAIVRSSGVAPEKVDPVTGKTVPAEWAPVGYAGAILPFLRALGEREALHAQLERIRSAGDAARGGDPTNYYDEALILFGKGWLDGRYAFDAEGRLRPFWAR